MPMHRNGILVFHDDDFIEGPHSLVDLAPAPIYTSFIIRRAFIVWMHCGQKNSFLDVCNYYYRLAKMEEALPVSQRVRSRNQEFKMYNHPPPTSPYQDKLFPDLYTQDNPLQDFITKVDGIKNEPCLFNLEGMNDVKSQTEIIDTSNLINKYCISHVLPLKRFFLEFKEFTRRSALTYTLHNVAVYIKRKMLEEEMLMVENYFKTLHSLEEKRESARIMEKKMREDGSQKYDYYINCKKIAAGNFERYF